MSLLKITALPVSSKCTVSSGELQEGQGEYSLDFLMSEIFKLHCLPPPPLAYLPPYTRLPPPLIRLPPPLTRLPPPLVDGRTVSSRAVPKTTLVPAFSPSQESIRGKFLLSSLCSACSYCTPIKLFRFQYLLAVFSLLAL
jgi:hypothetical protein